MLDDTEARAFAVEAAKATALKLGLPLDDATVEIAVRGAHQLVDAFGGLVWRGLHDRAVAEAKKIQTVKDADASRIERLKDR